MFFEADTAEAKRQQQAELKERFEVVQFVPQGLAAAPCYILDRETGVEYLYLNGALTPLVTPDGKPKVKK